MPLFSLAFRPFFLLGALWSALAIPVWLAAYLHGYAPARDAGHALARARDDLWLRGGRGGRLSPYGDPELDEPAAGRGRPARRARRAGLAGRLALFCSATLGSGIAALVDLAFTATLMAVVARELVASRNFRNLPMVAALALLFSGNLLVHLQALDVAYTAALGNRLGIATLAALIALVGGRIVPAFTRNWLARMKPAAGVPASPSKLDLACLVAIVTGLAAWVAFPDSTLAFLLEIAGGLAAFIRVSRWRGLATLQEPLLAVLHLGYAWLGFGLAFLGLNGFFGWLPPSAGVHAVTVGTIGTMTLAVMTRVSLGHSGRPLTAGAGTSSIYVLVTLAAILRVASPLAGAQVALLTSLAGIAWTAAFGLFAILYGPLLLRRKPA